MFKSNQIGRSPSEIQIQREIWETIWKDHPQARRLLFHVPNESTYNNSQQASSGVIPGVPDLLFIWQGLTWYIELKDDEGKLSDSQAVFHSLLDTQDVKVYVFYSAAPAIEFIKAIINDMLIHEAMIRYKAYISPYSDGSKYEFYLSEQQRKKQAARARKLIKK